MASLEDKIIAVSKIQPSQTICVSDLTITTRGTWYSMYRRYYYSENREKTSSFIKELVDELIGAEKGEKINSLIPELVEGISNLAASYSSDAPDISKLIHEQGVRVNFELLGKKDEGKDPKEIIENMKNSGDNYERMKEEIEMIQSIEDSKKNSGGGSNSGIKPAMSSFTSYYQLLGPLLCRMSSMQEEFGPTLMKSIIDVSKDVGILIEKMSEDLI